MLAPRCQQTSSQVPFLLRKKNNAHLLRQQYTNAYQLCYHVFWRKVGFISQNPPQSVSLVKGPKVVPLFIYLITLSALYRTKIKVVYNFNNQSAKKYRKITMTTALHGNKPQWTHMYVRKVCLHKSMHTAMKQLNREHFHCSWDLRFSRFTAFKQFVPITHSSRKEWIFEAVLVEPYFCCV